ncbi:MAG: MFS transporter [Dysgonamonadaceae bacterium]|nr:MFS transporter [Dysgonamonadaceae bacterium]
MQENKKVSPWAWIPSLYLMEGLPYAAVMTVSLIMYKRMGVSNTDIALYTSLLYLPWVIKPLWSPFIDMLKTKRWWIVVMQLLIGAGFAGIAFSIPLPFFFQATLVFFWIMAFSSATHDIAADGFYMLGLDSNRQSLYVGVRNTFYRIATALGQGILVILAGFLESSTGAEPLKINISASPDFAQSTLFIPQQPEIQYDENEKIRFITDCETYNIGTEQINADSAKRFLAEIRALNLKNGFISEETQNAAVIDNSGKTGNLVAVAVRLSGNPDENKEIALNTSLNRGDKSISIVQGERLTFNANNCGKTAYIVFQADPKLNSASSAEYRGLSGNIPLAWSITFFVLAGTFVFFSFYHRIMLPKPDSDRPRANLKAQNILGDFAATFVSFFKKPHVLAALFFMLTYRFSEAQLLKLIYPFLLDSKEAGGLGLTTGQAGFVYGTLGIIGLTIGGIIGGIVVAKGSLKKWLWPMALSMLLTVAAFLYLSFTQTGNMLIINACVFIEQFGYGFGFTAYTLYLIYFSRGGQKTAHYAICTGFMALGMMIPGLFAGWLQELLGYNRFFIWVLLCSALPILGTWSIYRHIEDES